MEQAGSGGAGSPQQESVTLALTRLVVELRESPRVLHGLRQRCRVPPPAFMGKV